jgi:hypothetical protein
VGVTRPWLRGDCRTATPSRKNPLGAPKRPVIAIVGSAEAAAGRDTFDAVYPLVGQSFDLADALRHAAARLEWTTAEVARSAKGGSISFRRPGAVIHGLETTRLRI